MRSRAVLFVQNGVAELGEVEVPDPKETEIRVHTEMSSISVGTERWVLTEKFYTRSNRSDHPTPYPCVPGYQKVGIVEAVGKAVKDVRVGDRVFTTIARIESGAAPMWGGHIEHSVYEAGEAIQLPEGFDLKAAASLVLAQVGVNGGSRGTVKPGDLAVVLGDGMVGQWAAQTLRSRGARVILAGRREYRLALARKYSADRAVNVREESLEELVRREKPEGAALVVETVATRETVGQALGLLRHDGHCVLLGWYVEGDDLLSIHDLQGKELTLWATGGWLRPRLMKTIGMAQEGSLHVAELMTRVFTPEDAPKAYRLMVDKSEDFLGMVIDWRR
ncbi:MAG: zinc-binding dehydrogenase [Armatimonadetes bacterium]|nr:zinc-binding dehydrogenase [Armatimonadota bacterium]